MRCVSALMSIRFRTPDAHTPSQHSRKRALHPQGFTQNMAASHAGSASLIETDMRRIMRGELRVTQGCPIGVRQPDPYLTIRVERHKQPDGANFLRPWILFLQKPINRARSRIQGVSSLVAGIWSSVAVDASAWDDPDPMIRHHHAARHIPARHVAAQAVRAGRDRTGYLRRTLMARKTDRLIGRTILRGAGVRVMARRAGNGPVAQDVAGRLHEAYGLVSDKHRVVNPDRVGLDHAGEPMAASAQAEFFVSR
jgi:hypothetical protein